MPPRQSLVWMSFVPILSVSNVKMVKIFTEHEKESEDGFNDELTEHEKESVCAGEDE